MEQQGFEERKITDFNEIVLLQVNDTRRVLNLRELDMAEMHLRVLKELLGADKEYYHALDVLNDEYEKKQIHLNPKQREETSNELKLYYTVEHFGLLRELLKRKRYSVVGEAEIIT